MSIGSKRGMILWTVLSSTIAVAYVLGGTYLVFYGEELQMLKREWRIILGILFIAYGTFRAIRSVRRYQSFSKGEEV